ncbi:MAG: 16S rRNA (cytosine(1402)-N(4))-methyltransferase RsmH [Nitrospirae bacterium]|nr:16S rRNA (cytosine(1402)-N(4))-methyltransferase RsmH [Nitrospirota bacterium]
MGEGDPLPGGYHVPVLPEQVLSALRPRDGGSYIDMTVGGAGHASLVLQAADCRLLALDRDPEAVTRATRRLAPFGARATVVHAPFDRVAEVAARHGFAGADGILMDLGVSSRQLDSAERGFSFRADAPLDMRMDPTTGATAADLVNTLDEAELARIFIEYGEERHARRIARAIVAARAAAPIATTLTLAGLVERSVPGQRGQRRIHPATRVFQALRIAVNDELGMLARALPDAFGLLAPGGRLAVISFHSLEDRMVKQTMRDWCTGCVCPPSFPECRCGRAPQARPVTRGAAMATEAETGANPRARSARLRAVEKLAASGEKAPQSA